MDKVALVTGASAGIGQAVAIALLQQGCRVVLAARRQDRLDAAIAESGAPAGRALAVRTDVGDHASVRALFATTVQSLGRLDAGASSTTAPSPRTLRGRTRRRTPPPSMR
jgi:NADP-dependent 3-hydroxy acid dehydrogenase YdfG